MNFAVSMAMDIIKGPPNKRALALLGLACWFAMGAYVASTVAHYIDLQGASHSFAVVTGGTFAAVAAAYLKTA